MNLPPHNTDDIIDLAEVISDARESAGVFDSSTLRRRKVSKTSLLLGILGSISLMLLMEIATVIYKSLSTIGSGCIDENASQ